MPRSERIETNYPALYAQDVVSRIYQRINSHRLALVVGFTGVGKSSVANFLTYNTKHPAKYTHTAPQPFFCKFNFSALTNESPKSFIYHLLQDVYQATNYWDLDIPASYLRSNFNLETYQQILDSIMKNVAKQDRKLVIVFDPAEKLMEHTQRHKVYDCLRNLIESYRQNFGVVMFSNHPNLIKSIDSSNFGALASSLNNSVVWIRPTSLGDYHYFLYHDYNFWERWLFRRLPRGVTEQMYQLSGGIAALINHFRDYAKQDLSVQAALNDYSVLNTCYRIITSFSKNQQTFLYYVANRIERPIQISRAEVEIMRNCGIIQLDERLSRFTIPSQLLQAYLQTPEAYQGLFGVHK